MSFDLTALVKHWPLPWGLAFCACFAVVFSGLTFFISRPRARELLQATSWVERARLLYPMARTSMSTPVLVGMAAAFATQLPLRFASTGWDYQVAVLVCLGSAVVANAVGMLLRQRLFADRMTRAVAFHDNVALRLAIRPNLFIVCLAILGSPRELDVRAGVLTLAVSLAMVLVGFGAQAHLLRLLGMLGPPSDELTRAMAEAVAKSGVTVRETEELHVTLANAFAFPSRRRVWMTRGAVDVLDHDEKVAVLLHELGHISEPFPVRAVRVGTLVLSGVLSTLFRPLLLNGVGILLGLLGGLVAVLYAGVLVRRRMELRADAHAGDHLAEGRVYATALEKLYRVNLSPAVMPGRGVHASLYDRMLAAGVTPEYPRPAPPPLGRVRASLLVGALAVLSVLVFFTQSLPEPAERWNELRPRIAHGEQSVDLQARLEHLAPLLGAGRVRQMVMELSLNGWCSEAARVVSLRASRGGKPVVTPEELGRWCHVD